MGGRQSILSRQVNKAAKMTTADSMDGFVKSGFEHVREVFRNNMSSGLEVGGSFAAYYKGDLAVHLWGGLADKKSNHFWKKDTVSCFYSTTKSPSSIVIGHMVDRGLLNFDEKVAKYWPEFAQNGKGDITLEQLMSHQAGLPALDEPYNISLIRDNPKELCQLLEKQKPLWVPGEGHGYHPFTFSLYLDQLVRKTDPRRRNLSQYFREEIANPFGIDFQIGLPKRDHHRATKVRGYRRPGQDSQTVLGIAFEDFKGDPDVLIKVTDNIVEWTDAKVMNDPNFMELPVGSTHGFGTSEAVAKLHGIVADGGIHHGRRLLSDNTIKRFQRPLVNGPDKTYGMDYYTGLGVNMIIVKEGHDQPNFIFGHGGFGGQYGAADPKRRVGFAYVSNFLNAEAGIELEQRWVTLYDALYECIDKIENKSSQRRRTFHFASDFLNSNDSKL